MVVKPDYNRGLARGLVGTNPSYNSWSPIIVLHLCVSISWPAGSHLENYREKNPCARGEKKAGNWTYAQNSLPFLTRSVHRKRLFHQSKTWAFLTPLRWSRKIKPSSRQGSEGNLSRTVRLFEGVLWVYIAC